MAEAGRPRIELTTEQVDLIERLAGLGLTQAQIADFLPMSEETLSLRIRGGCEEISTAYARGRAVDLEAMSSRHRKLARGELGDVPFTDQRKALEWRMERQHGWGKTDTIRDERPEQTAAALAQMVRDIDASVGAD